MLYGCIRGQDVHRRKFLAVLAATVEKHNWLCHTFCLLDNHYHLVIESRLYNCGERRPSCGITGSG
jgi:REP element-mobilizing transposase RayT